MDGGRGGESHKGGTKPNETKPLVACVHVRVGVQERVQKCVCRCADLALLSEGCIRVACRKGRRTTAVLQKKKKTEPQSHQNQNFLIQMERTKGKGEGVCGVGESGVWKWKQENGRRQKWGRTEGEIGGGVEKIARTQRHKRTIPERQPHRSTVHPRLTTRPPSLRCLSAPPKLVPMDFCISVLQQWANYNQAPSPN